MPKFVVVHVTDDGGAEVYGTPTTWERAKARADRMEADLDELRDEAGGGAGSVMPCPVQPFARWSA